jgi:hypothetical protein
MATTIAMLPHVTLNPLQTETVAAIPNRFATTLPVIPPRVSGNQTLMTSPVQQQFVKTLNAAIHANRAQHLIAHPTRCCSKEQVSVPASSALRAIRARAARKKVVAMHTRARTTWL